MPVGVGLQEIGVDYGSTLFTDDHVHVLRILAVAVTSATVAALQAAVAVSAVTLP